MFYQLQLVVLPLMCVYISCMNKEIPRYYALASQYDVIEYIHSYGGLGKRQVSFIKILFILTSFAGPHLNYFSHLQYLLREKK